MPIYRKLAVEVEAHLWDGTALGATPIIDWILSYDFTARYHSPHVEVHRDGKKEYVSAKIAIDTLEGIITASPGDFIIKGVLDEFYPCKPEHFGLTYELVA